MREKKHMKVFYIRHSFCLGTIWGIIHLCSLSWSKGNTQFLCLPLEGGIYSRFFFSIIHAAVIEAGWWTQTDGVQSNWPLRWVPFLDFDPLLHLSQCVPPLHMFVSVRPRSKAPLINKIAVLFWRHGHLDYSLLSILVASTLSRVWRTSLSSLFCGRLVGPQLDL